MLNKKQENDKLKYQVGLPDGKAGWIFVEPGDDHLFQFNKLQYFPRIQVELRKTPEIENKNKIRLMNKSECFEYLGVRSDSTSVHNGKESDWMYVKTTRGEYGWVFSSYVEKIPGYSSDDVWLERIRRRLMGK